MVLLAVQVAVLVRVIAHGSRVVREQPIKAMRVVVVHITRQQTSVAVAVVVVLVV
jgi:hypothetical protein